MTFRTLIALTIAGTLSLGVSNDAFAKKGGGDEASEASAEALPGGIVKTNVGFIDDIFMPISEMFGTLNGVETSITEAKTNLLTALGAEEGAELSDALAGFVGANKKALKPDIDVAAGKFDFTVAEDAGENVQTVVDALKSSLASVKASIGKLKDLGGQAKAAVEAAKGAADSAKAEVDRLKSAKDIKGAMALGKALPKIPKNLEAATKLPGAITGAISAATDLMTSITGAFGGGEEVPAEEAAEEATE